LSDAEIAQGLASFTGSPHRAVILTIAGRTVLDDAYNANPESMLVAVDSLCHMAAAAGFGQTIAVLGQMAELGDDALEIHRATGEQLSKSPLDILLAVGAESQMLATGFAKAGGQAHACASVDEAAKWLARKSQPRDFILVKGSRSAAMETILPMLETACNSQSQNQD